MLFLPQVRDQAVIVGTSAERAAMTSAQMGSLPLGAQFHQRDGVGNPIIFVLAGPADAVSDAAYADTSAVRLWVQIS